ncbi:hypothetical protein [Burkholderia ambifaria]|uniref:hypothetical protein n=1 Tax=Burkholderia ambifaria TaxID=152480 RepID=UPI0012FDB81E|nr:hypothetical protein [Burkholderia ambifaria]
MDTSDDVMVVGAYGRKCTVFVHQQVCIIALGYETSGSTKNTINFANIGTQNVAPRNGFPGGWQKRCACA